MSADQEHASPPEGAQGPAVAAPSHAERCRTLARAARVATLSTIARDPDGYPFGSFVTVAVDGAGRPLLLLSELAEHTANLKARPEASILLAEPVTPDVDPLGLSRMTLLGACRRVEPGEADAVRDVFLAAHPRAVQYATWKDFAFYRLEPASIRYVGGFGRMSWVDADAYRAAEPDPLVPIAEGIIAHMNDDHADALIAYARGLARIEDARAATMFAVDRYGFEMSVTTGAGKRTARVAFDAPVSTAEEIRKAMVALVREARARLA